MHTVASGNGIAARDAYFAMVPICRLLELYLPAAVYANHMGEENHTANAPGEILPEEKFSLRFLSFSAAFEHGNKF